MNVVVLMGCLTRNPDIRYTEGLEQTMIARYTLAVDRKYSKNGQQSADFISCVAFGKSAEFAEKYFHQGTKIVVRGRIQTGSYTNRQGQKMYTSDVVIEEQDFAGGKKNDSSQEEQMRNDDDYNAGYQSMPADDEGFMRIPEGFESGLPFV